MEKEARYYSVIKDGRVVCHVCPAGCVLKEGKYGICMGRFNKNGKMIVSNYGEVVSLTIDPIEKKPLYHFYPGSAILSTGPNGCNLSCPNCQNWNISQERVATEYIPPERMAAISMNEGSFGVAYTYTEPFIWFEYLLDTMPMVRSNGGKNVLVTNGYVMPEPLSELLTYIDAMNIDLKSIEKDFYRKVCHGKLKNVQETIIKAYDAGVHIELTNLLITGLNDSQKQITGLIEWIAEISDKIPIHFSRYFPVYKMNNPPTSTEVLKTAYDIAREKLDYVYLGNIHIPGTSDTYCPDCGAALISRDMYHTIIADLTGNRCGKCGRTINIVTSAGN